MSITERDAVFFVLKPYNYGGKVQIPYNYSEKVCTVYPKIMGKEELFLYNYRKRSIDTL